MEETWALGMGESPMLADGEWSVKNLSPGLTSKCLSRMPPMVSFCHLS